MFTWSDLTRSTSDISSRATASSKVGNFTFLHSSLASRSTVWPPAAPSRRKASLLRVPAGKEISKPGEIPVSPICQIIAHVLAQTRAGATHSFTELSKERGDQVDIRNSTWESPFSVAKPEAGKANRDPAGLSVSRFTVLKFLGWTNRAVPGGACAALHRQTSLTHSDRSSDAGRPANSSVGAPSAPC